MKVDGAGPLITAKATYDSANNVDLTISRTAFDVGCANFGGTFNQSSAAGGIGNVYRPALTGPFRALVADLFTLENAS